MAETERRACPWCTETGSLFISSKLVAKPIGEWSLAGMGMKAVIRQVPVLVCSACNTECDGTVDADGGAQFNPEGATTALTDGQLAIREGCALKEV